MKKLVLALILLLPFYSFTQTYSSNNISLISMLAPNTSTDPGNRYSGCWGWYQQSKNKEYAISGASNGTYFIDVTNPATPSVSAYVDGRHACIWREMKTYKNYCYIISSDPGPNKFQIVDMQYLPDSVHVVHNGNWIFNRGHTIWIDKDKMYIGGVAYNDDSTSPMAIYSLATPSLPLLMRTTDPDIPTNIIDYVHDMYVRNDTIYASVGWKGLFILKYTPLPANNLTILGTYNTYQDHGYNHSSFLTKNGKYLVFCDESPPSLPIHLVDVQNFGNIQPIKDFRPAPLTTPHNPYIVGNDYAVVSCYQDGLVIYDISNPNNPVMSGYFDTYPQGGISANNYGGGAYAGNWGAYPYLPSGIIIANDIQNGVFILNPSAAYGGTVNNPLGVNYANKNESNFIVFPNPANEYVSVNYNTQNKITLEIKNMLGQIVYQKEHFGPLSEYIDITTLESGSYFISLLDNDKAINKKLVISH